MLIKRVGWFISIATAHAAAQQPAIIRLDKPVATHPAEWTSITRVRELPGGRVLVLDVRDQVVKLVDFTAGTATVVGAKGNGPGEYVMPTGLFALPGDSSVIYDEANSGRPMLVSPRGVPAGTLDATVNGMGFLGAFAEVDRLGRIYRGSPRPGADGLFAIERMTRNAARKIDTVAWFSRRTNECAPAERGRGSGVGAGDRADARARPGASPYPSIEEWAVAPDGRVAVVCSAPYHVKMYATNAARIIGPAIPYPQIKVTDAEKQEWREERGEPVAILRFSADGSKTAGFEKHALPEPSEWPDYLPPFVTSNLKLRSARFAPDGSLWIERAVAAKANQQYDVIGTDARLAYRVTLPPRTRIVGFGPSGIYAVAIDDDDVQRLQRFRLPPLGNR